MYDYNFFENYKINTKKTKSGTGIMLAVFMLAAVILASITAYTFYINTGIKDEVLTLEQEINKPDNVELEKRLIAKQEMLDSLTIMSTGLVASDAALMATDPINASLLETIVLALPIDAQIDAMTINQDSVSINGIAAKRSAIAEFEKALRESELVLDVHVSNISSETIVETDVVNYIFSLTMEIGGGIDENIN